MIMMTVMDDDNYADDADDDNDDDEDYDGNDMASLIWNKQDRNDRTRKWKVSSLWIRIRLC